jgi:hypothetical protein
MLKKVGLFLCLAMFALPAGAEDFIKPTLPDLVRTLVRFKAINLDDDKLLDDYAIITECKLYKAFYGDDFKWDKVRSAIRESIQMNVSTFPTGYSYETRLQLDRYNFEDKLFRFTDKTSVKNVNAFGLYNSAESNCPDVSLKYILKTYRAVLDTPVSIAGLPLEPKDAEMLLQQMRNDKNIDRIIYARFNLRVVYIDQLRDVSQGEISNGSAYSQSNSPDNRATRLDVSLDSAEFYEDVNMTKLVYRTKY